MSHHLTGKDDADWLVHDGNQQWGPYPTDRLIELLKQGQVDWLWNIWREGMANWTPAARLFTIPELSKDGQIRLRAFAKPTS